MGHYDEAQGAVLLYKLLGGRLAFDPMLEVQELREWTKGQKIGPSKTLESHSTYQVQMDMNRKG